jgi:hypothetical protein
MVDTAEIRLERTCHACPEQYDAFLGERQVGYLRLRHGRFRVDCPDVEGATVYEAHPKGDGFFDADEREHYLSEARRAIVQWLNGQPQADEPAEDEEPSARLQRIVQAMLDLVPADMEAVISLGTSELNQAITASTMQPAETFEVLAAALLGLREGRPELRNAFCPRCDAPVDRIHGACPHCGVELDEA